MIFIGTWSLKSISTDPIRALDCFSNLHSAGAGEQMLKYSVYHNGPKFSDRQV